MTPPAKPSIFNSARAGVGGKSAGKAWSGSLGVRAVLVLIWPEVDGQFEGSMGGS